MWRNDPHYATLMIVPKAPSKCSECGCVCSSCGSQDNLEYHHEIEELQSKLRTNRSTITKLECDHEDARHRLDSEINRLQEELVRQRDRYDRLYDSHKKMSKQNQTLEEKLLTMADSFEMNRRQLEHDMEAARTQMNNAQLYVEDLEDECNRYKQDCNIAVQLLHANPTSYVAQKIDALPIDLQQRLRFDLNNFNSQSSPLSQHQNYSYPSVQPLLPLNSSDSSTRRRQQRIPMATFPPTAMMFDQTLAEPPQQSSSGSGSTVAPHVLARCLGGGHSSVSSTSRSVCVCRLCSGERLLTNQATQTWESEADWLLESSFSRQQLQSTGGGGGFGGKMSSYPSSFTTAKPYSSSVLDI